MKAAEHDPRSRDLVPDSASCQDAPTIFGPLSYASCHAPRAASFSVPCWRATIFDRNSIPVEIVRLQLMQPAHILFEIYSESAFRQGNPAGQQIRICNIKMCNMHSYVIKPTICFYHLLLNQQGITHATSRPQSSTLKDRYDATPYLSEASTPEQRA